MILWINFANTIRQTSKENPWKERSFAKKTSLICFSMIRKEPRCHAFGDSESTFHVMKGAMDRGGDPLPMISVLE